MTNGGGWSWLTWIVILGLFALLIRLMVSDQRQRDGKRLKSIFPHPDQLERRLWFTRSACQGELIGNPSVPTVACATHPVERQQQTRVSDCG